METTTVSIVITLEFKAVTLPIKSMMLRTAKTMANRISAYCIA